jgi:PAS domain S-box-containing protein
MKYLHNLPIKRKLMVITMLVTGTALLLASGAFIAFDQATARTQMVQTLNRTATMVADNSLAGGSFKDAGSTDQVLKSLSAQPDIAQACVYDKNGRMFARYVRPNVRTSSPPPRVQNAGCHVGRQRLELFQSVKPAGQMIGTIYLEADLSQMTARLWRCLLIGALALLASAATAFFLSARLQKVVSEPLAKLAETVAAVRTEKNYAVRAARLGDAELDVLIDGFNEMLAQIQERDANLERRVAERTQALAESLSVLDATLSSTTDGILVVNPQGKKIFQNRRAVELWKIPPAIARSSDDHAQIRHVMNAVSDPAKFTEQVAYFYAHPDEKGQDEIQLNDGTIMERITAPVVDQAGRNHGRIWTFREVTHSRKYEAALRESQARFKFIFESVPVGIASRMVHADGRISHDINEAHLRICGLTREQHDRPGSYDQLIPPEDRAREQEFMRRVNAGERQQFSMEKRLLRPDGTMAWAAFSYQRQAIADGGFEELTTLVDITESKRAAAAVSESELLLRSIMENSKEVIFVKDRECRFVYMNPAGYLLNGLSPEKLLGHTKADFHPHPETTARFMADDRRVMESTLMETIEEEVDGADGTRHVFLTTKVAQRDSQGKVIGLVGVAHDISDRKRGEEAVAYERDLLRALLENSTDRIYFKDAQSRFIKCSASTARTVGAASADELTGKSDFDIFSEEHARTAFEAEQEIIRTGQPILGKIERESWKDGREESWVLTTKMPLRDKSGKIIGTFGIGKDITDLKRAQTKIEQTHQQLLETSRLAGMAEVATSVLHNVGNVLNSVNVSTTLVLELVKKSRLRNLGRLAALINAERDNLAAFFMTDPRGRQLPGYLTKLTEHLAAEHAALVAEIELTQKNIEHIKDIVTMQQNYAKVSGVVEKVKVTDLVEDALSMNASALTRHRVAVVRDYPAETVECNVERQKVLQILVNLIRNAKYACDDSGRPDKRLTMQVRAGNGRAQITVLDNGVGIAAENMTRIFHHGFTTRERGHGFGLHSGALAAKELGGALAAYSDGPGTGARFVLDLPLQPPQKI